MNWDWISKSVTWLAVLVAYRTFRRQNLQSRTEAFFTWNKWFDSAKGFGLGSLKGIDEFNESHSMLSLCTEDDLRLRQVPWEKKEALLAFFEELKLSINSKLVRADVVSAMFGYYAIKIADGKYFWEDEKGERWDDPTAAHWSLWRSFVEEMRVQQAKGIDPNLRFDEPWWDVRSLF